MRMTSTAAAPPIIKRFRVSPDTATGRSIEDVLSIMTGPGLRNGSATNDVLQKGGLIANRTCPAGVRSDICPRTCVRQLTAPLGWNLRCWSGNQEKNADGKKPECHADGAHIPIRAREWAGQEQSGDPGDKRPKPQPDARPRERQ